MCYDTKQSGNLTLSWHNISVKAKRKKSNASRWRNWFTDYEDFNILENVHGRAESGSLVAVMGASGCGKTTLLAAISKRLKTEIEGQVLLNGKPVDDKLMTRISGFIPQNDVAINTLTIREHMNFMSQMRMDRKVKREMRRKWIDCLLLEVGLLGCDDTELRALSGGERKRLLFAVQLLTDPPILLCDEPTTGLDSYSALSVVEKLQQLALKGKVVMCSIHQPTSDVFHCFHQLVLIAGGRVAYHGPVALAAKYFSSLGLVCPEAYNSAEFYVRQLSIVPGKEEESSTKINYLCSSFSKSQQGRSLVAYPSQHAADLTPLLQKHTATSKPSWFTTLYWLTWRSYVDSKRSKRGHFLQVIVFMVSSLVLSLFYMNVHSTTQQGIQDTRGLLYLITSEVYFTCAYRVLHTFPLEIPVFLRESSLYPASAYYMGKFITQVPRLVVEPMIFLALICIMETIAGGESISYWRLIGPLLLSAYAATAYGCMMSSIFESLDIAAALAVPLDLLSLLMAGMFYNIRSLPKHVQWVKYLSQLYYTNEIVAVLHWRDIHKIPCETSDPELPCLTRGEEVLDKYSFSSSHFERDIVAMISIYFIFHLLAYVCLWFRIRNK
ncbi:protein scarlet isoform X2 [Anabrus simplex]|uniref:protein scarlet isoform X2 n=1 Tax=Anabrus simplex TaxID=316456 RepID=UPI0035A2653A